MGSGYGETFEVCGTGPVDLRGGSAVDAAGNLVAGVECEAQLKVRKNVREGSLVRQVGHGQTGLIAHGCGCGESVGAARNIATGQFPESAEQPLFLALHEQHTSTSVDDDCDGVPDGDGGACWAYGEIRLGLRLTRVAGGG